MAKAFSTSFTRRSVVAGLTLTAAPVAVMAGANNAYAPALTAASLRPHRILQADPEVPLVAVNWKGLPETLQTHSIRMNLRPAAVEGAWCAIAAAVGSSALADDGVLHDSVAEVIGDRRYGKDVA